MMPCIGIGNLDVLARGAVFPDQLVAITDRKFS
jgi:hypothetical protein